MICARRIPAAYSENGSSAMAMNFYRFDVSWTINRPRRAVFEALTDLARYPSWWRDYTEARQIDPVIVEFTLKAALPYKLVVTNRFITNDPLDTHFRLELGGDIVGWIDFDITDAPNGETAVHITQECEARKTLLRILAPIAKPAFRRNHAIVMRNGLKALNELLPAA
jgi:hypothetical protein